MVQRAVAEVGGTLPDFSKQEPDHWMESCVRVDPVVSNRITFCRFSIVFRNLCCLTGVDSIENG